MSVETIDVGRGGFRDQPRRRKNYFWKRESVKLATASTELVSSYEDIYEATFTELVARRVNLSIKRFLDISLATLALIALAPFFVVVSVLIRLDSPGPALFRQVRWGEKRKKITIYKFRSMYWDQCDPEGVIQAVKDDPRITRIGSLIRRTNIDELPQLWNVIKGDMSLVGPRCHAVDMLAGGMLFEQLVPSYHERHRMKPGITGLAQIRGLRGPTTDATLARKRIENDLTYIRTFNVFLDVKILLLTIVWEVRGGVGF